MHRQPSSQPSPRLMLPPPGIQSRWTAVLGFLHSPAFFGLAKITIFIAKAFSLLGPCEPFAVDPRVVYPLLAFAALDFLGMGVAIGGVRRRYYLGSLEGSLVLLVCHAVVVGFLVRRDRLCLRRVSWDVE